MPDPGLELGQACPGMSTGSGIGLGLRVAACMLFSFERPGAASAALRASRRTLKTAQMAKTPRVVSLEVALPSESDDHRQDIKGMWWMPWHQEPKKDVDGCDKPR